MDKRKKITLSDVAAELNISSTVVSMVLNGRAKKYRISEAVEQNVRRKAKEMGYQPNSLAQGLRTGKTRTIGLILGDVSNPFFSKIASCVEKEAVRYNYQVMFASSDESSEKFERAAQMFLSKQVDGLIVAPTENSEKIIMDIVKNRKPVVLIDRIVKEVPVDYVQIDNKDATYRLANLIIDQGFKKIAYMTVTHTLSNFQERYLGFKQALDEHNIPFDSSLFYEVDFFNFQKSVREGVYQFLRMGIDAIYCASNRIGTQVLIALKERNTTLTEHFTVVSFDNPDEFKLAYCPVSCVEQPIPEISEKAVEILMKKINKESDELMQVIIPARIVIK